MENSKDIQLAIEYEFSRKHAASLVKEAIADMADVQVLLKQAEELIMAWAVKPFWPKKEARIKAFMANNSIQDVLDAIVSNVIPLQRPVDFTAVVGPIAERFNLVNPDTGKQDYPMKVQTLSELVAVVCETDLYDIYPAAFSESGHLSIKSNYSLPLELQSHLQALIYLPPMLVPPKVLTKNSDCAYLLDSDKNRGAILKAFNYHEMPIALDALNIANSTCFALDTYVLSLQETPNKPLDTPQKAEQFYQHVGIAKTVYQMLVNTGNKFYMSHKFDKRGRVNMAGHHVNLQSYEYKKALMNLHKEEFIPLD